MKIEISSESIDVPSESLVLGFFSDERPPRGSCGLADWRLNGKISKLIKNGDIDGTFMQKVLVDPSGRFRTLKILLVGMGDSGDLTYERLYKAGFTISRTMREINCKDFAFDIPGIGRCGLDVPEMTGSMVSGLFDILRDESGSEKPENPKTVRILADDKHVNEVMQGVQKAIAKESSGRVTVEIERSVETK